MIVIPRVAAERKLEETHQVIDLLEPYPPRQLVEPGPLLTPAGRLEWWREHRSHYRYVGTLRKTGWNHLEFRQDGSVTLPDNERHDVYVEERVDD